MTGPAPRLLSLLSLLQVPREWPGAVLAERLGVTPRTVRRDVERLRALGYRVAATPGAGGGYRLEAGGELPPLRFDEAQAVALAIALARAPSSGVAIDEAAARALATLRRLLPSRLRHRIDAVAFSEAAEGEGGAEAVDPAVLEAVTRAVRERTVLRFAYGGRAGPPRRAEPHGVVARGGRWYLVGWDLDRDDWRSFRLDRLAPRSHAGARFSPRPIPAGGAAEFVASRARGGHAADRWPCVGRFELALPLARVAPWVRDGSAEAAGEAATRLTLGSWSWASLLADVLRFDAPFRILGPDPLVAIAGPLAERLRAAGG